MGREVESELAIVAYDLARSQLVSQKDDLRNLRNQASFVIAASGIIATVFASLLTDGQIENFLEGSGFLWFSLRGWFVFGTFTGSVVFAALVITGWKTCNFDLSPSWILCEAKKGAEYSELLQRLAIDADKYFDENEAVLRSTQTSLVWAVILTVCQVPCWLLLLFGRSV